VENYVSHPQKVEYLPEGDQGPECTTRGIPRFYLANLKKNEKTPDLAGGERGQKY